MDAFVIIVAKYFFILCILLLLFVLLKANSAARKNLLKLSLLSFPISFLLTRVLGSLFYNPRPFVIEHISPLIPHSADNGFPSDHTVLCMTIAAVLFTYNKKLGLIAGLTGIAVGVARIIAKVHSPIDILGSVAIALAATYLSWRILKRFFKKPHTNL